VTLQPIFGNWQVQVQNELSNLSSDQQIQVKDEALPKLPDGGEIRVEGS
jgi:hypothetical protein